MSKKKQVIKTQATADKELVDKILKEDKNLLQRLAMMPKKDS